jgi:hypothetical protein
MIMPRDQNIFNFLDDFHIATMKQIQRLFFNNTSYRFAADRIKYLCEHEHIKRIMSTIDKSYAYFTDKKPLQVHHNLIRAELYSHLLNRYHVTGWRNEYTINDVRPDALCFIEHFGIEFPILVEIHLTNRFNFEKYKDKDFKPYLGAIIPRVLICTDRQVTLPPYKSVKFKVVGVDMVGLENLLK